MVHQCDTLYQLHESHIQFYASTFRYFSRLLLPHSIPTLLQHYCNSGGADDYDNNDGGGGGGSTTIEIVASEYIRKRKKYGKHKINKSFVGLQTKQQQHQHQQKYYKCSRIVSHRRKYQTIPRVVLILYFSISLTQSASNHRVTKINTNDKNQIEASASIELVCTYTKATIFQYPISCIQCGTSV